MYFLDLSFVARRSILSLPPWHGARWHAWLREASHPAAIRLEDMLAGLLPFQSGQKPVQGGERLRLRLCLLPDGLGLFANFLISFLEHRCPGEFSVDSLRLVSVQDAVSQLPLWEDGHFMANTPLQFDEALAEEEISALCGMEEWTLEFLGPLRLSRGRSKGADIEKYALPRHLTEPGGLEHLLARVRLVEPPKEGELPANCGQIQAWSLRWEDLRYNAGRKMVLGGICGSAFLRGVPDWQGARRLVLGQYFGAGKNSRFGFGYWRIPELDGRHTLELP